MMNQQMGNLGITFDASKVDPAAVAGQLPVTNPGETHLVVIERDELKQSRAGKETGTQKGFFELNLRILEGQFQGSSGVDRINYFHDDPNVKEMAFKQLSRYGHATGNINFSDTSQLHNIPFRIRVEKDPNNPQFTRIAEILYANGEPLQLGKVIQQGQAQGQMQGRGMQQFGQPNQQQTQGFGQDQMQQPVQNQIQQSGFPQQGQQTQQPVSNGMQQFGQNQMQQQPTEQPQMGGMQQFGQQGQGSFQMGGGGAPTGNLPKWAQNAG